MVIFMIFQTYRRKHRKNLPPGPWGLPILGCLPYLGRNAHLVLTRWAKTYGDVYSVRFGTVPVVVLNGFGVIREALVKHGADDQTCILVENYDRLLEERRHYTMRLFRIIGVGRKNLESAIFKPQLEVLMKDLTNMGGKATDIYPILRDSVANITLGIVFGFHLEHNDSQYEGILDTVHKMFELNAKLSIVNFVPFLEKLPLPRLKQFDEVSTRLVLQVIAWLKGQVSNHHEDSNHIKSFADSYKTDVLKYRGQKTNEKGPVRINNNETELYHPTQAIGQERNDNLDTIFSENQIISVAIDLIVAGFETVTTTLRWGCLYMAMYPEIQAKVQEEIDSNLGDRNPNITDKGTLPYTEATIMEIQRLNCVTPLAVPHSTTKDVEFRGYTIPKDTMVLVNLWSVMTDPVCWPNPEKFDPQRHLNERGRTIRHDVFTPFSLGKRSCVGAPLARMELFLFFTFLMQKFTFRLPNGASAPVFEEGTLASTLTPPAHQLCVVSRGKKT
ncbi:cytochrome P450 2U1-like [Lingula anatina]|uniref:Cytochrome P450 2U1-like n=1 Tax=Lingula anatina TaxID=7574 RepID=A0A1S3JE22_LINAN|nr:cytochrome P450 2U1-like [Lingula anatina]|eukprot:XP_013408665.1 cytochrome P450 2U1-like [Lingula anatina]